MKWLQRDQRIGLRVTAQRNGVAPARNDCSEARLDEGDHLFRQRIRGEALARTG